MSVNYAEIGAKGKKIRVPALEISNKTIVATGGRLKIARLREEWDYDVDDPASVIDALKSAGMKADIFTFWQRLPETEPKYDFHMEWENLAVLPVDSYERWWNKQMTSDARRMIRKAQKTGVDTRICEFDDEFIKGVAGIFNESPVRQGKPFWHYGKSWETIKKEFSPDMYKGDVDVIGAYFGNELIGFIALYHTGKFTSIGQILSKISHRDKAPTNALLAKAVEICASKKMPYLVYAFWNDGSSLTDFKERNGFEKVSVPRYFVPLTLKGKLALKLNAHHGLKGIVPAGIKKRLVELRRKWYEKS